MSAEAEKRNSPIGRYSFACLKPEKEGLKIQNIAKIDIMSLAKVQCFPKNEKNSLKMLVQRKNIAKKNVREICGPKG